MAKYIVGLLVSAAFIGFWYWLGKRKGLNNLAIWVPALVVGLTLGLGAAAVMIRKDMADRGEVGEYLYDKRYSDNERAAISKAVDMFNKNACRNMYDLRTDVAQVHLAIAPASPEQAKAHGWDQVIRIEVVLVSRPRSVNMDKSMGGKTLTYMIGGGKQPGVEMMDMWSTVVCLQDYNPNGAKWVPLEKADQLFMFLTPGARVEETLGGK